jgi:hypothetical protein
MSDNRPVRYEVWTQSVSNRTLTFMQLLGQFPTKKLAQAYICRIHNDKRKELRQVYHRVTVSMSSDKCTRRVMAYDQNIWCALHIEYRITRKGNN